MIDESKSFEEQIKLLKKNDYLYEFWHMSYYDDKKLNLKVFNLKFAYILNVNDKKLFEEVFGHTSATLVDKLINTIHQEENQIITKDTKKNKDKLYEKDDFNNFVTQPRCKRIDLIHSFKIILEFNEIIQLDLI